MHSRRYVAYLAAVFLLASCESSTERTLLGRWRQVLPDTADLVFKPHHMLEMPDSDLGTGTWRIKGDQLFTAPRFKDGTSRESAWTILKLSHDEFQVRTVGDIVLIFRRVE